MIKEMEDEILAIDAIVDSIMTKKDEVMDFIWREAHAHAISDDEMAGYLDVAEARYEEMKEKVIEIAAFYSAAKIKRWAEIQLEFVFQQVYFPLKWEIRSHQRLA